MRTWTEERLTVAWTRSQQGQGVSRDQLQPLLNDVKRIQGEVEARLQKTDQKTKEDVGQLGCELQDLSLAFTDFVEQTAARGLPTTAVTQRQRSVSPARPGPAEAPTAPSFGMVSPQTTNHNPENDPGKLGCRFSTVEQWDILTNPRPGMQTPVHGDMRRGGGQGGAPNNDNVFDQTCQSWSGTGQQHQQ